jgi:molybdopterin-guanine dinucleotide biosynthesis protein A
MAFGMVLDCATSNPMKEKGAIVLCGGRSTRMGTDKASLPIGDETMLARTVRLLTNIVLADQIVVVAAADQQVGSIPDAVRVVVDARPNRGPLEGLAAGLRSCQAELNFVTSCDAPLLVPEFVDRLFARIDDCDCVVPSDQDRQYVLSAVYRRSVLGAVEQMLENDDLRMRRLIEKVNCRTIDVEQFRDVDPQLLTLENVNSPEDFHRIVRFAAEIDAAKGR